MMLLSKSIRYLLLCPLAIVGDACRIKNVTKPAITKQISSGLILLPTPETETNNETSKNV